MRQHPDMVAKFGWGLNLYRIIRRAPRSRHPRQLTLVVLGLFLAGCSSVPDAVNPVEWYKGALDLIAGDRDAAAESPQGNPPNQLVAERGQAAPGADQPTPKLSTVPNRPTVSSRQQRAAISRGLVADRDRTRRYSSEVIARQGAATNPLSGPAAPPPAARRPLQVPPAPAPPVLSPPPQAAANQAPPPPTVAAARPPAAPRAAPQVAPWRPPVPPQTLPPLRPSTRSIPALRPTPRPQTAPPRSKLRPDLVTGGPSLRPTPFTADGGTIVVSSAGVQRLPLGGQLNAPTTRALRAPAARSSAGSNGVRSLAEFSGIGQRGSYQVATILFRNGSAKLGARDRQILRQVARQHGQVGGTIRVVGHASHRTKTIDPVRHKFANLRVSTARAEAVGKELVRLGAKPSSLFVGAASDSQPRYQEHMPSGEAGNRRADIYIDF